jgi:hypothetical protein
MGCHDQQWAHRLRRFSALLMTPIATVGLWPVVSAVRDPASPRATRRPPTPGRR